MIRKQPSPTLSPLSHAVAALWLVKGAVAQANPLACRLLGLREDNCQIEDFAAIFGEIQPDGKPSRKRWDDWLASLILGEPASSEWKVQPFGDGPQLDVELTASGLPERPGTYEVVLRNISHLRSQLATLRESETKFRTLADNAPVLLKMANARNLYIYFSLPWLRFTGIEVAQATNNQWLKAIHPADLARTLQQLDQAYKRRERFEISYRLRRADGQYRAINDVGVPYTDENGFFIGYISSGYDVTDQREQDERRRRLDVSRQVTAGIQASLEEAQMLLFTINAGGQIVTYNRYLETTLEKAGLPMPRSGQLYSSLFIAEAPIERPGQLFDWLRSESIGKTFQLHFNPPQGEARTFQCSMLVLQAYGISDGADQVTIVGEDITDRLRVARKLEDTSTRLQDFLDNASELVMLFSARGKITYVNKAWQELLGFTTADLRNLKVEQVVDVPARHAFKLHQQEVLGGEKVSFQTSFRTKDRRQVLLKASLGAKLSPEGKVQEYQALLYDNTEAILAERFQRLYNAITRLGLESDALPAFYRAVHEAFMRELSAFNLTIGLRQPDGHYQLARLESEDPGLRQSVTRRVLKEGLLSLAADLREPLLLTRDEIIHAELEGNVKLDSALPQTWICLPFAGQNQLSGFLILQGNRAPLDLEKRHLGQLSTIAGQVASAILRIRSEAIIKEQAARLKAIIESATHLVLTLDSRRRLSSFNTNFSRLFDAFYGTQPAVGLPLEEIWRTPGSQDRILSALEKVYEGQNVQMELSVEHPTAGTVWFEVFANPIRLEAGDIREVSVIANNITVQRGQQEALRASEEKFRSIFESFQDIYFQTDKQGRIRLISPSVEALLGYRPEQMLGHKVQDFLVYSVPTKRSVMRLISTRQLKNFEVQAITREGDRLACICNVSLNLDRQTGRIYFEGVVRDISDIKQANEQLLAAKETAERSLKVKEKFLANMSHEIRTPMNGIIGLVDLLGQTGLDERQRDYVETIKNASGTLLTILNDILDLSKIEAGKMDVKQSSFAAAGLMEKLRALFGHIADKKHISFKLELEPSVPAFIRTDETRLIQIVSNLVANAIKFTDEGQVHVRAWAERQKQNRYLLFMEVADSGIGIAADKLNQLFSSFTQLDAGSTKVYGGTGLGLAISRTLVELLGGQIGVESEIGEGSRFTFSIPVRAEEAGSIVDEAPKTPTGSIAGRRILLVDDNATNRKVAGEMLRSLGVEVHLASSGPEAIEITAADRFDLICMDIQMPQMDGVKAQKLIRKQQVESRRTPILAMTAYSMREDRERFLSQGFDGYLAKPITLDSLASTLSSMLNPSDAPTLEPAPAPKTKPVTRTQQPLVEAGLVKEEVYQQLTGYLGQEGVVALYEEFEQEAAELLSQLPTASNPDVFLHVFHTIKGSAGTLGLEELASQAYGLEHVARHHTLHPSDARILAFMATFERFSTFLASIAPSLP